MEANISSGTSKENSISRSSSPTSSTSSKNDDNPVQKTLTPIEFAAAIEQARRNSAAVSAAAQMVNLFGVVKQSEEQSSSRNMNKNSLNSPQSLSQIAEKVRAASAVDTVSAIDAASHRPISPETSSSLQSSSLQTSSFVVNSSTRTASSQV